MTKRRKLEELTDKEVMRKLFSKTAVKAVDRAVHEIDDAQEEKEKRRREKASK